MTLSDPELCRLADRSLEGAYGLLRRLHESGLDAEELYLTVASAHALLLGQCSTSARPRLLAALGEAARRYAGEERPS